MHAYDRFLPEWFTYIGNRRITLPRFQRFEAWGNNQIENFLTNVLRGLPTGAALILEVAGAEPFPSRVFSGVPANGVQPERVVEQLLDGQQRLTALWKALHDLYAPEVIYLANIGDDSPEVIGQNRWEREQRSYPLWVDVPAQCWERKLIPIWLLRPNIELGEVRAWIRAASGGNRETEDLIGDRLQELQTKVREFNLPYLKLAATVSPAVALDVFIKMNTSSVRLSAFDVVVALVEATTNESLHEKIEQLRQEVPRAERYATMAELALDVASLRQDRVIGTASYQQLNFTQVIAEWDEITASIRGMLQFLEEEYIFDAQRLPTYVIMPVIAALWAKLPNQPDRLGNARRTLKRYMWRAFLTTRYEHASNTYAFADYRALLRVLNGEADETEIPIFNDDEFPLPLADMFLTVPWPKRQSIRGRGLLCLQFKYGAEDIADGNRATIAHVGEREYHHLYPQILLQEAGVAEEKISLALNCALLSWRTNRALGAQDPITYLRARVEANNLGEESLRRRLITHLVPYQELNKGYAYPLSDISKQQVRADYEVFVRARAAMMVQAIGQVMDDNINVREIGN